MYEPHLIRKESFQGAWIEGVKLLNQNNWELRNLVVQIMNPLERNEDIHQQVIEFTRTNNLLNPKHVAYTIFPHGLYRDNHSAEELFSAYNRQGGFYNRIKRRSRRIRWGTYFRRMTFYKNNTLPVNQLRNIIESINVSNRVHKVTYTIIIQRPSGETTAPRGGPCLNFAIVQLEPLPQKTLGLLCLYRNQDFLERAYGNFWGLCNLLNFLANETNSIPGPLTCIISHAYANGRKQDLRSFIHELE